MARGHSLRGQAFSFEVDFKALEKMLNDLPKAMGKAVLRRAITKAAVPIRDEAKANLPRDRTGNLADSIVISTKLNRGQKQRRGRSKQGVEVFVGATAPHAYLVEWGSAERTRKDGSSTGVMPSNPFFTRAWDATKAEALKIMVKEIEVELMKAAKRLATRAERGTLGKRQMEALR